MSMLRGHALAGLRGKLAVTEDVLTAVVFDAIAARRDVVLLRSLFEGCRNADAGFDVPATRCFEEAGWKTNAEGGFGGNAMAWSDLAEWPFCYLEALAAVRSERGDGYPRTLPVFGVLFYDERRIGPVVYAGTFRCSKKPKAGLWAAYSALTGHKNRFQDDHETVGSIRHVVPTAAGRKRFPSLDEVRWFEVPLSAIASAAQLKAIVEACIAMAGGNDAPALDVVASHSAA